MRLIVAVPAEEGAVTTTAWPRTWPTSDEIAQAVGNLWTGDPWQYTEITSRVLGEVENIRAWNEKMT
jgi:hypothetical protein